MGQQPTSVLQHFELSIFWETAFKKKGIKLNKIELRSQIPQKMQFDAQTGSENAKFR
jgi:hypothetical protein